MARFVPLSLRVLGLTLFVGVLAGRALSVHPSHVVHVDEPHFLLMPIEMIQKRKLVPGWYNHPASPHISAMYVVSTVVHQARMLTGVATSDSIQEDYSSEPLTYYRAAKYFSVFLGWLIVLVLYFAVARLGGDLAAVLAVGCLSLPRLFMPYLVIGRPDAMAMLFTLLVGIFSMGILLGRSTKRQLILVGAAVGLSVATKYTLVLNFILPLGALLIQSRRDREGAFFRRSALVAGVAIGVFFLVTPGILFSPFESLRALHDEATMPNSSQGMQVGFYGERLWTTFSKTLPHVFFNRGFFRPFLVLSGIGAVVSVVFLRTPTLLFLVYFTAFVLAVSWPPVSRNYWFLPTLPLIAGLVGVTFGKIWAYQSGRALWLRRASVVAFCGLVGARFLVMATATRPTPNVQRESWIDERMAWAIHEDANTVFHNLDRWGSSNFFVVPDRFDAASHRMVHLRVLIDICFRQSGRELKTLKGAPADFLMLDVPRASRSIPSRACVAALLASADVCDRLIDGEGVTRVALLRLKPDKACPSRVSKIE